MTYQPSVTSPWPPRMLSVLRIVVAFLFLSHGLQKVFDIPPAGHPFPPISLDTMFGWSAILELVGGALLLIGLFTRPVAFILAGEMAVAYFQAHAPQGFWPLVNKGEPAVLYCFVFLYFVFEGGGPWSLDYLIFGRSKSATADMP